MEPTGNSGQTRLSPSPVSSATVSGEHQHRDVTHNTQPTAVAGNQHPINFEFTPLERQKVTPLEVRPSKLINMLSLFARPRIIKGFTAELSSRLQDLRRRHKRQVSENKSNLEKREKTRKELLEINKKLGKLRPELEKGRPKDILQFQQLLERKHIRLKLQAELGSAITCAKAEQQIVEQTEQQLEQQKQYTEDLLKSAISAGARCIAGLKKVYKAKREESNAENVYRIDLGDFSFTDVDRYNITLKGCKLAIDQCHQNQDGTFTIRVAEARAKCVSASSRSAPVDPVGIAGSFTMTLKPPLSDYLSDVLTAPKRQIPGEMQAKWKGIQELLKQHRTDGTQVSIMDYIDIEVTGVKQEIDGSFYDLLTKHGAEQLVKVLTPVAICQKEDRDQAALIEINNGIATLQKQQLEYQSTHNLMSEFLPELDNEIALLPEGEPKAVLQTMRTEVQSSIESATTKMQEVENALDFDRKRLEAATAAAQDRDSWLEGYNNMVKLWFDLRAVHNKVSPEAPKEVTLGEQRIRLGESGFVDIENLRMQLSQIQLKPEGGLEIMMPRVTARLGLGRQLQDPDYTDMKLEDVSLSLDPPLDEMVWDILTLKIPFNASRIYQIQEQFRTLATALPEGSELPEHPKLKDLIHLNIGKATKVGQGGDQVLDEGHTNNSAALAKKVSDLSGAQVRQGQIEELLGSQLTMDDGSQQQLMNLLSMALLGIGHVATPEKKKSIRQVAETVAQVTSQPSGQHSRPGDDWVEVPLPPTEELLTAEITPAGEKDEDDIGDNSSYSATNSSTLEQEQKPLTEDDLLQEPTLPEVRREELPGLEGISGNTDHGETVSFQMHSQLTSLFGQLSLFKKWLLGKTEATLLVVTSIDERGVVALDTPRIKLRKAGVLRCLLVNRMLKKAIRKRSLKLVVDEADGNKKLRLQRLLPESQQLPPEVDH